MYTKLFAKILDSTIWLEPDATRLVWITFLAVMDEDGFVALSAVGNVAARARVSIQLAQRAIQSLEAPDTLDPEQEHEGRRIERVPSGWMVLNAKKYRDIIRSETQRAQTRERVAKHRAKHRCNADVTQANKKVTSSEAYTEADKPPCASDDARPTERAKTSEGFEQFWAAYPRKKSKATARKAWAKLKPNASLLGQILASVARAKSSADWRKEGGKYIPHPATWLNAEGWSDGDAEPVGAEWWTREGYGTKESALNAGVLEPA